MGIARAAFIDRPGSIIPFEVESGDIPIDIVANEPSVADGSIRITQPGVYRVSMSAVFLTDGNQGALEYFVSAPTAAGELGAFYRQTEPIPPRGFFGRGTVNVSTVLIVESTATITVFAQITDETVVTNAALVVERIG